MKHILGVIGLVVAVGGASPTGSQVELQFFRAESKDGVVTLSWQSKREVGLDRYELWRKGAMTGEAFTRIDKEFAARGDNILYSYTDADLFKASANQLEYQLVAVSSDGVRYTLSSQTTAYTSTAVRRTWGSIKAMFQ